MPGWFPNTKRHLLGLPDSAMTRRKGKRPQKTPPPPKATDRSTTPSTGRLIGRRFLAAGIDDGLLRALIASIGLWTSAGRWLLGILVVILVDWVGVARFGATPGKAIFGLRVRSIDEKPIGWVRAAMRSSVKEAPSAYAFTIFALSTTRISTIFEQQSLLYLCNFAGLGLMIYLYAPMFIDSDGRARHDLVADTVVISLRQVSTSDTVSGGFGRLVAQGRLSHENDTEPWVTGARAQDERETRRQGR